MGWYLYFPQWHGQTVFTVELAWSGSQPIVAVRYRGSAARRRCPPLITWGRSRMIMTA